MKELYELKMKLMDELKEQAKEVNKKSRMTAGDLDTINKMVKSIDRLCEILKKDDEGYSGAGTWNANMHGNYGDHYSNARQRDSRGRYSNNGGYSRNDGYSRTGDYSMGGDLIGMLEDKMHHAKSERERDAIRRCIDAMGG